MMPTIEDSSRLVNLCARDLSATVSEPASGCNAPERRLSKVVLPLPLGPTSATRSPG